jgi:hypothetical protein
MGIEAILILGAVLALSFIVVGVMQIAEPKRFIGPNARWWMTSWRLRDPVALRINGAMLVLIGAVLLGSMTYLVLT